MEYEIFQQQYREQNIHFILAEEKPCVRYQGKTYYSLDPFLSDFPEIKEINVLCKVCNFLFGGNQYSLIEDIFSYQNKYNQKIAAENSGKSSGLLLSQYGVFDVSVIKSASLENETLVFYVESNHLGIPYKTTCTFPKKDTPTTCTYSLLPF